MQATGDLKLNTSIWKYQFWFEKRHKTYKKHQVHIQVVVQASQTAEEFKVCASKSVRWLPQEMKLSQETEHSFRLMTASLLFH